MKKYSQVCFEAKECAALRTLEFDPELKEDQCLVKADYDVISAGTELANYHDLPNTCVGGDNQHKYPRFPGYSVSGHVVEIGPEVTQYKVGDRVLVTWSGHRSWFIKSEKSLFPVADGVDQKVAAMAHLVSFPMLGVRKLRIELGEATMVAGLGILGLFAVQFAKLSGACPVLACDFSPERRALAKKLGADYVFDPREPDFIEQVKKVTNGRGPETVVEVTGYLSGLQQALEYVARFGRISILGCTRISDAPINVYQYIHGRGVQIIGAHTATRPKFDRQPGMWPERDDYETFMKLVSSGRLQVEPVINRIVSPRDTAEIYRTIGFEKNPPFGILFDWTDFE